MPSTQPKCFRTMSGLGKCGRTVLHIPRYGVGTCTATLRESRSPILKVRFMSAYLTLERFWQAPANYKLDQVP